MDENPYQAPQTRLDDAGEAPDKSLDEAESLPHTERDPTGALFVAAADRSGFNIDALRFVFDARIYASEFALDTPQGRLGQTPLCPAVVRFAEELYGDEALAALKDWGLVSGDDVRQVVEALVQSELVDPHDHESAIHLELGGLGPLSDFARLKRPINSSPLRGRG